jgi:dedicator of cytokinesis protein 3
MSLSLINQYRGYEWEKFGAFCERMLNKHPSAQLLKTAEPPEEVLSSDGQWIQCTAVVPEPNRSLSIFTNPQVPLAIKTHYEHR